MTGKPIAVVTGGPEIGEAFASLPFDHLLFTGATSIARHVMHAAAENLVPVTLELGGKSPQILFEDADLDAALPVIVNAIVQNAGQTCSAGSRLLVQNSIKEKFTQKVVELGATARKGNPMLAHMRLKMVRPEHFERWLALFRETADDLCTPEVAALVANDYDIGTIRPQGRGFDIGAYEFTPP